MREIVASRNLCKFMMIEQEKNNKIIPYSKNHNKFFKESK